jgi:NTP pyrophosphatase (non-canonical NTP hydrolase)
MNFDEYQKMALDSAIYPRSFTIYYPALGLAGEAGEVANEIKKIARDDNYVLTEDRKLKILHELGGVLWYLAALAEDTGYTLDQVAQENLKQLQSRKERGVLHGSGSER